MSLTLSGINNSSQYTIKLQSLITSQQSKIQSQQTEIQKQQSEIQSQRQDVQKYQTRVQQQEQKIQRQDSIIQSQNQELQHEKVQKKSNAPSNQDAPASLSNKLDQVASLRQADIEHLGKQAVQAYQSNKILTQTSMPTSMTMPINLLA
ncbi:MAG: hypothetical protein ACRKFN_01940 [Desulfitobacterium sp.]